ncbi:MAG: DUF2953 domain-containing protein [Firmicutes bacterium]|nr:DUF2953 domain-containing protein [Bacillota bacterium]
MGWLITLGVLGLLAVLPLGASVIYDEDGVLARLVVGPLKITLYPRPVKEKKPGKNKKKSKSEKQTDQKKEASGEEHQEAPKQKKSGGPITDFLPLVKVLLQFLDGFRRKLRVNVLELKLIMAGDDPCDLAVNYGRAWAAVGNLMPQLERIFVIKKRNIEVECDFTADRTLVLARLDLTITLGRLLGLLFVLLYRAAVRLIKIVMKRKGGAVNEPKSS